jgi:predicted PurR-regulated permease PerM
MDRPLLASRSRAAWSGVVLVLGAILALFVLSFVGTFVFGLFVYYGVRPLHRRLRGRLERRQRSAALTILFVVVPVVALVGYSVAVAFQELVVALGPQTTEAVLSRLPGRPRSLGELIQSLGDVVDGLRRSEQFRTYLETGIGTLGRAANALFHLTLSLVFAFFLLRDGPRLGAWFREDVAGDDATTEAYLAAVDADLETVYFGNVLTVLLVGAAALAVYHGFNLVSPPAIAIPFPTLLALLTALATFVPLVVGKLVYVPTAGYLVWRATAVETGGLLPWAVGFLVVAVLVLDLVPQTFVRPLVSGRSIHSGLVLFAYVLGAALFGWYGLFLGPLFLVLVVQAANVVLPELLHGDRITPETHTAVGSEPTGGGPAGPAEAPPDGDDAGADPDGQ